MLRTEEKSKNFLRKFLHVNTRNIIILMLKEAACNVANYFPPWEGKRKICQGSRADGNLKLSNINARTDS